MAQEVARGYDPLAEPTTQKKAHAATEKTNVFSGFSIGVSANIGYAFASSPAEMYHNKTLENMTLRDISRQSVTLGAGIMGRIHLFDHMHVGAEGYVSTMPMKSGSNIKHGYAGALVDGYFTLGKVALSAGTGIGGGKIKRMYVPDNAEQVSSEEGVLYNASYTTTPFFYFDPYIGVEVPFSSLMSVLIKLDYLLPFGKGQDAFVSTVKWSNFISPSGPRLHIGVLIGK